MNRSRRLLALLLYGASLTLRAHVIGDAAHDAQARLFAREFAPVRVALLRHAVTGALVGVGGGGGGRLSATPFMEMFGRFAPAVRGRAVGDTLFVESNGLPAHGRARSLLVFDVPSRRRARWSGRQLGPHPWPRTIRLARTPLQTIAAKPKFLFIHHLPGGETPDAHSRLGFVPSRWLSMPQELVTFPPPSPKSHFPSVP
ncbi:MAG: hypothetical protein RLZZ15_1532 [Verrucomicrobiota bacterium]|jgi:hypothetical protein